MRRLHLFFLLSLLILLFAVVFPLLPGLEYSIKKSTGVLSKKASYFESRDSSYLSDDDSRVGNRLVIPVIDVDALIVEGRDESALRRGVWLRPNASKPDTEAPSGNTVLTGHRFLYTGFHANTFYNLDKVIVGDFVYVFWADKKYSYVVSEIKVVAPTAIEVESDFGDWRLTLYTCHPLWTATSRLVVVAKPV